MADNLSIGNLVMTTILLIVLMVFGTPLLLSYQNVNATGGAAQPGAAANVINASNYLTNNGIKGIYNPLNKTAFGTSTNDTNSSGGFNIAPSFLQQYGGLAFIYVGIGQFLSYISELGVIIPFALGTLFGLIPGITSATSLSFAFIGSLMFDLIALRIIVVGVSAWMKADLWNM